MMMGRPLMITRTIAQALILPQAIDDEELSSSLSHIGIQPRDKPSYIAFWVEAIKLVQISGQILEELQARQPGSLDLDGTQASGSPSFHSETSSRLTEKIISGDFHDLLRLDAALTEWHEGLPAFLKRETSPATELRAKDTYQISAEFQNMLNIQARALTVRSDVPSMLPVMLILTMIRYLHLKIVLTRPVLTLLLVKPEVKWEYLPSELPLHLHLQDSMAHKVARHCIIAARKLSGTICEDIELSNGAFPAWRFNVFCRLTSVSESPTSAMQDANVSRFIRCSNDLRSGKAVTSL